jgi:hypothetical protein
MSEIIAMKVFFDCYTKIYHKTLLEIYYGVENYEK